jgi:hypothetical protein
VLWLSRCCRPALCWLIKSGKFLQIAVVSARFQISTGVAFAVGGLFARVSLYAASWQILPAFTLHACFGDLTARPARCLGRPLVAARPDCSASAVLTAASIARATNGTGGATFPKQHVCMEQGVKEKP